MCNRWCLEFGEQLVPLMSPGVRVLEVGSRDVNGTLRSVLGELVDEYVGVDIEDGPGVDVVMNGLDIVSRFGRASFQVVVSTEMIEHCEPWREALVAMVETLAPGGLLLITTRSPGFALHGYPSDHWRFTRSDLRAALDPVCDIEVVASDPTLGWACGVGVIARRRADADMIAWRDALASLDVYAIEPGVDVEGVHRLDLAEPLEGA